MFHTLQSEQRITKAAVGTTPDGHATVWSTLRGFCDMVNQRGELLEGLPEYGRRMGGVDTLFAQVQTSVAAAVNETTRASGTATASMSTVTVFFFQHPTPEVHLMM